jgi:hypothetical protein
MATLQKPAKKKRPHTQLQKTTTFSHHKSSQPHGFGLMGFFSVQQQVKSSSTEQDNRLMTRFLTPTTGKENYIGKKIQDLANSCYVPWEGSEPQLHAPQK